MCFENIRDKITTSAIRRPESKKSEEGKVELFNNELPNQKEGLEQIKVAQAEMTSIITKRRAQTMLCKNISLKPSELTECRRRKSFI